MLWCFFMSQWLFSLSFVEQGRTVTVKLKTVKFDVKSRASTLLQPVSSAEELYQVASQLLRTEMALCSPSQLRLRLMGELYSSSRIDTVCPGRG